MERLNILYRGPLSSCNYRCNYCPFAKRSETHRELRHDQNCLRRFIDWIPARQHRPHGIFFTPWGEALTRKWYREAMVQLSHLGQIARVAVQTNLSMGLDWTLDANLEKLALWCTYHPSETHLDQFIAKCRWMTDHSIRYSVGVVGLAEHAEQIEELRARLPRQTYLWINAYKSSGQTLDPNLQRRFEEIDSQFPLNNRYHLSLGKFCRTGLDTISVDGAGDVRRCHFIEQVLGNIYQIEVEELLRPRCCTKASCGCHIGYVHLEELQLHKVFGSNVLERVPLQLADVQD